MTDLIALLHDWPALVAVLLIFGMAPGPLLRLIVRIYPTDHPRRKELVAELYAQPFPVRPLFLAQQFETALYDGIPARRRGRVQRRANLTGRWTVRVDDSTRWPSADEIRELAELLDFNLGDNGHAHFANLAQRGRVPVNGRHGWAYDYLPQAERAGLARRKGGSWELTNLGRRAGRLLTAQGPPPDGIVLEELDRTLAGDRKWVQRELQGKGELEP